MSVNSLHQDGPTISRPRESRLLATIVFVPCFAVLLVGGAITRLLPSSDAAGRGSLFHEARAAAYDCVAFALMG